MPIKDCTVEAMAFMEDRNEENSPSIAFNSSVVTGVGVEVETEDVTNGTPYRPGGGEV